MRDSGCVSSRVVSACVRRCALFAVALHGGAAHAATPLEVELTYETHPALAACPDETSFRSWVSAQVGRDPFRTGAAHRVHAAVRPLDVGAAGSVVWDTGTSRGVSGQRELRGKDCADVVRATAFAVAVQIQLLEQQQEDSSSNETGTRREPGDGKPGQARSQSGSGPRANTNAASEKSTLAHRAEPTSVPLPARPRTTRTLREERDSGLYSLLWGVGGAVRWRTEPRATPEGRMFVAVSRDRALGELSAGATTQQHWGPKDGSGFDFWSFWGSASGCFSQEPLLGCVTGRLERVAARGTGVDVSRDAAAWLAEVGPRAGVWASPSSTLRALLYVEARATIAPARVWLDGERVWKTPAWSFTIGLDLAARWSALGGR